MGMFLLGVAVGVVACIVLTIIGVWWMNQNSGPNF